MTEEWALFRLAWQMFLASWRDYWRTVQTPEYWRGAGVEKRREKRDG
jgi:hypothetical protein